MESAEAVALNSRNPAGFHDLLASAERTKLAPVPVTAYLRLPEKSTGRVPLVITSIGSGGFASGREVLYAEAFASAGIAMMAVDSFGSRGFSETTSDQGRISIATSCADAVYALGHMSGDPRIDPERIALFGYSRGGGAVMMTNNDRLQGAVLGSKQRFAAYLAMYPSVWLHWTHPAPTPGPIFAVFAERDDMAPLVRERERMAEMTRAGARIETLVIPEAGHSFDAVYPAEYRKELNRADWDIAVEDDGAMQETNTGIRLTADWPGFLRDVGQVRHTMGGHTGHGPAPRTVAIEPLLAFLQRTFRDA